MLLQRIADLESTLRDLVRGADMCAPYFSGAARDYMLEVKRTAEAALGTHTELLDNPLPTSVIDEAFCRIMGAPE